MAPPPKAEVAPQAPVEKQETGTRPELAALQAEIQGSINNGMDRFSVAVRTGKFDFAGPFNEAEEIEKNDIFKMVKEELKTFLEQNKTAKAAEAPELKNAWYAWVGVCVDFMTAEVASYDNAIGEMGATEAKKAIDALKNPSQTGNCGKNGIGSFEVWVSANPTYKPKYETWKAAESKREGEKAAATATKPEAEAELTKIKSELGEIASWEGPKKLLDEVNAAIKAADTPAKLEIAKSALTGIATLKAKILPAWEQAKTLGQKRSELTKVMPKSLDEEFTKLAAQIRSSSKESDVDACVTTLSAIAAKFAPIEALRPYLGAEGNEIPENVKEANFEAIRNETKTPEQALAELQRIKQSVAASNSNIHESGEGAPTLDRALAFIDKMKDSKWKKPLAGFIIMIATVAAAIAKFPWIGEKVRGTWISNRMLAKRFNDKEAEKYLRVEEEFVKFGLPRSLVADIGNGSAKEIIETIRDGEKIKAISKDAGVQEKLGNLATALEQKGGTLEETPLVEFMDPETNPNWFGVEHKTAVATAPAAPAPAPAPTAPPATATATASATPAPVAANTNANPSTGAKAAA